jgi:two-component system chemotaxis sensor kinase CheA
VSDLLDAAPFLAGYLSEADEHLASATAHLLVVDAAAAKGEATPRQVQELFRSLHTIKGLSAMVGVEPIVDIAHAMETVLRAADRTGGRLSSEAGEVLVKGIEAIGLRVRALEKKKPVAPAPTSLLDALSRLQSFASTAGGDAERELSLEPEIVARLSTSERGQLVQGLVSGRRAVKAEFVPSPERAAEGTSITSVRERLGKLAELVKILPISVAAGEAAPSGLKFVLLLLTDAPPDQIAAAAATTPEALVPITVVGGLAADEAVPLEERDGGGEQQRGGVVRVDVARLDDALQKLSALVVTRFRLGRAVAELEARGLDVTELQQIVNENSRQLRDLRASIMRARMIPAAELLERVPLLVRGLGRTTGKKVRLQIEAENVELDKAVAERISPAIIHLIRNAVDHAIETPAERQQAGKPEEGLVRVTCRERSDNQIELTVTDDGRGVDRQAVARRAGRPVPENDEALLALLVMPGLSTRQEITTTSGRGVGMDIVKRIVVDELGGELMLRTAVGSGTSFTVRIPLSITIVDAFSFVCGGQTFVVPVAMVEEIQELDASKVVRGPDRRQAVRGPDRRGPARAAAILERRGEAVPVLALDELFGLGIEAGARRKAIIVRRNGEPLAFVVDRMLGQQEVVVRPLGDPLVRVTGVTGSTDLGDGRPTLVLDLPALGGHAGRLAKLGGGHLGAPALDVLS